MITPNLNLFSTNINDINLFLSKFYSESIKTVNFTSLIQPNLYQLSQQ